MDVRIVSNKISLSELQQMARDGFGDMVKAVVDVEKAIMAVGGELHADLINIRPRLGNRSMEIDGAEVRGKIGRIINNLINGLE